MDKTSLAFKKLVLRHFSDKAQYDLLLYGIVTAGRISYIIALCFLVDAFNDWNSEGTSKYWYLRALSAFFMMLSIEFLRFFLKEERILREKSSMEIENCSTRCNASLKISEAELKRQELEKRIKKLEEEKAQAEEKNAEMEELVQKTNQRMMWKYILELQGKGYSDKDIYTSLVNDGFSGPQADALLYTGKSQDADAVKKWGQRLKN